MNDRPARARARAIAGDAEETHAITDEATLIAAVAAVTRGARWSLYVFTPDLEPRVFDNPAFVEAVRRIAVNSRNADIRFLLRDADTPIRQGNRLIELARQLTSFIDIRLAPVQGDLRADAFIIADSRVIIHRPVGDRPEGTLRLDAPREAVQLAGRFQALWNAGRPAPELRRLHL